MKTWNESLKDFLVGLGVVIGILWAIWGIVMLFAIGAGLWFWWSWVAIVPDAALAVYFFSIICLDIGDWIRSEW